MYWFINTEEAGDTNWCQIRQDILGDLFVNTGSLGCFSGMEKDLHRGVLPTQIHGHNCVAFRHSGTKARGWGVAEKGGGMGW